MIALSLKYQSWFLFGCILKIYRQKFKICENMKALKGLKKKKKKRTLMKKLKYTSILHSFYIICFFSHPLCSPNIDLSPLLLPTTHLFMKIYLLISFLCYLNLCCYNYVIQLIICFSLLIVFLPQTHTITLKRKKNWNETASGMEQLHCAAVTTFHNGITISKRVIIIDKLAVE
jgi:hypothetical protein